MSYVDVIAFGKYSNNLDNYYPSFVHYLDQLSLDNEYYRTREFLLPTLLKRGVLNAKTKCGGEASDQPDPGSTEWED